MPDPACYLFTVALIGQSGVQSYAVLDVISMYYMI